MKPLNNYQQKQFTKILLLLAALAIAFFTLFYTNVLVKKLTEEERESIKIWAKANRQIVESVDTLGLIDFSLHQEILSNNNEIPVIITDENNNLQHKRNIAEDEINTPEKLKAKLEEMKAEEEPIVMEYSKGKVLKVYYQNSIILKRLQKYPIIQLIVVALFILISYATFSYARKSEQNQVWVGMSKETAHQLGTPISSIDAWLDVLDHDKENINEAISEMKNDLNRLKIITDRFSKIGSNPKLKAHNISQEIENAIHYFDKRTSSKVNLEFKEHKKLFAYINQPLFAWVLENLIKNAVDAMQGQGKISFYLTETDKQVLLDISDTGSGIPKSKFKTIFKPGYTTKKRGWGLGLSLVKRIMTEYHKGKIYIKSSKINEGTTFRLIFNRAELSLNSID